MSARRRTRRGYAAASSHATMPPNECPTTTASSILQSRQQLVVAKDQIPEAVEPIDVVVRIRRRPRMLGRINREAPRQIVEKRIPPESPRAVEKDQRRPCARR